MAIAIPAIYNNMDGVAKVQGSREESDPLIKANWCQKEPEYWIAHGMSNIV